MCVNHVHLLMKIHKRTYIYTCMHIVLVLVHILSHISALSKLQAREINSYVFIEVYKETIRRIQDSVDECIYI